MNVAPTTTVAGYLVSRLAEAGVVSVFGVPGDYNLGLLDAVADRPNTSWIGMASEQGAGYAADSYARHAENRDHPGLSQAADEVPGHSGRWCDVHCLCSPYELSLSTLRAGGRGRIRCTHGFLAATSGQVCVGYP